MGTRAGHDPGRCRGLGRAAEGGRADAGHPGLDDARTGRGNLPPSPGANGRTASLIIRLTARADRQDAIDGLGAGADDYVTKPFDAAELRARVSVGARVVELQVELAARIADLEEALARVDQLHGILPICSYCKKVRNDSDSWQQVEAYVSAHSAVRFSHGVCPECVKTVLQPELDELRQASASRRTLALKPQVPAISTVREVCIPPAPVMG